MYELSQMDKAILNSMLQDTRISYRDLARELGVSHSTIYNRVHRMIEEGVIKGFTLVIDYEKAGINGLAYIGIELKHKDPAHLVETLRDDPRVLEIHEVFSPYDLLVKACASDMNQLKSDLVRKISGDNLGRIDVMVTYKTHKDDPRINLIELTMPK